MKRLISCIIILISLSCSNMKRSQQSPLVEGEFDKQGHRGCRGLMPENTIPAMIHALDLGVTTLEMDVVITKDRKVILSHEPWFSQDITTKPDGSYMGPREERKYNIYWMTNEETKTFDVGLKPHPRFPQQKKIKVTKPLLAEVIDSVNKEMMTRKRPDPQFNIETKSNPMGDGVFHPKPEEFVELLMTVVNDKGIGHRTIIQSFDLRALQYLHNKYPDIRTAMLIDTTDTRSLKEQLALLGFIPTIYSPHFSLVNSQLIRDCHRKGIRVIPWTVNEKEKIEELKQMGVDGIISDYPNLFDE